MATRMPRTELIIICQIPGRAASVILPDPGGMDAKTVKYVVGDACVVLVPCGQCGAPIGSLCRGRYKRPTLSCHCTRLHAARYAKKQLRAAGKLQGAWRIIFQERKKENSKDKRQKSKS